MSLISTTTPNGGNTLLALPNTVQLIPSSFPLTFFSTSLYPLLIEPGLVTFLSWRKRRKNKS